jgi:dienelactone hydrolase
MNSVDQGWGETLASWGYVALTLDVFTPRGIKGGKTCLYPAPPEIAEDVYRGLDLLAARKDVDRNRIFLVGFGRGGSVALSAVERDGVEAKAKRRFRGAAAFYPACADDKGVMTVSTLVVIGALDTKEFDACRKMVQGEDDIGISRQNGDGIPIQFAALPNAYSGFDMPAFQNPVDVRGFHLEFSRSATEQSRNILRKFLQSLG